jgi:myo-inositol-1(or 4)-monophosphatase
MLMPLIPDAHWLSEESRQQAPLIHGEPTWVIDPLDGTREFVLGIPEWGVSVALFLGDELVLGAAGVPTKDAVFSGLIWEGRREARRNGQVMAALASDLACRKVVVSRNDYEHRRIGRQIPFETYPCGSAVLKLTHAADGTADVYLSTGPRSVWDVAGGVALLEAVGGQLMRLNGQRLALSPQRVEVPAYVAGAPSACLELLRGIGARA